MKIVVLTIFLTMVLVGCSKASNIEQNATNEVTMEYEYAEKNSEQEESIKSDTDINSNINKTKEEYIKEMGVTKEGSKIVKCNKKHTSVEYYVYDFEDTGYYLTYYNFYNEEEDFLDIYEYYKERGSNKINEFFDTSCYLHCYQMPFQKGDREYAYAGVMHVIELEMNNSDNNLIFLVEE